MIIAIDGPSGSGKSTISRMAAAKLGYTYIDTGAMYRAVALAALRAGLDIEDDAGLEKLCLDLDLQFGMVGDKQHIFLNGEDVEELIRTPEISMAASAVSARRPVRLAMVDLQRRIGRSGSVVMEGRDIGTNVFPEADVKIFLDASDGVRAQRRNKELLERGVAEDAEETLAKMKKRDAADSGRELAPLLQADDAVSLDTSALGLEEVFEAVLHIIEEAEKN